MKNKYLDKNIDYLNIDDYIRDILYSNDIKLISDLYVLNRKKLRTFGFSDSEITRIAVKLQLLGLDLNGKKY